MAIQEFLYHNIQTLKTEALLDLGDIRKIDTTKQIDYPGSGNKSEFVYDGMSRYCKILESVAGSVTDTKQFVWCGFELSEDRTDLSAITACYFGDGQTFGNSSYYYSADRLGSIRELTDPSGATVAAFQYDPFGRSIRILGTQDPAFGYAGYYSHSRSQISLTVFRVYKPSVGRWLSRDLIGERSGNNLFSYVGNAPSIFADEYGLGGPWHPPANVKFSCTNSDSCQSLRGKIWIYNRMIASHEGWDRHVPKPHGGNRHHKDEIPDLYRGLANCMQIYARKCQPKKDQSKKNKCDKKDPPPQPEEQPQQEDKPDPQPQQQPHQHQYDPFIDLPWWMLGLRNLAPFLAPLVGL